MEIIAGPPSRSAKVKFERMAECTEFESGPSVGKPVHSTLPKGVLISATGLILPKGLMIEDWEKIGFTLCAFEQGIQWAVGDWWAFGHHAYGSRKKVWDAAKALPRKFTTLMNWGYIARSVAHSRRREVLSFTHHALVASLTPADQTKWLTKAVQNKWSASRFQEVLREQTASLEVKYAMVGGKEAYDAAQLPANIYFRSLIRRAERAAASFTAGHIPPEHLEQGDIRLVGELEEASARLIATWTTTHKQLTDFIEQYRLHQPKSRDASS